MTIYELADILKKRDPNTVVYIVTEKIENNIHVISEDTIEPLEEQAGKWEDDGYVGWKCPYCGFSFDTEVFYLINTADDITDTGLHYCPQCGKRMNGYK